MKHRMGKLVGSVFAVGVLCGFGGPNDPQSTEPWWRKVVRQELQIVNKKLPGAEIHPLRDIHVYVEVNPVQPTVGLGIFFVIDVANAGSEPVEMWATDRWVGVSLSLWNADGVRVDVPDRDRTSKGNPGGAARRQGVPEHIKAEIERRMPFETMKPDFLPSDANVKSIESIKDNKVRLEPGEHFQVQVLVTKVLAEPETWWPEIEKRSGQPYSGKPDSGDPGPGLDPPEIASIGAGTYTLGISVGLFVEGHPLWGASLQERLTVRLGPHADNANEP